MPADWADAEPNDDVAEPGDDSDSTPEPSDDIAGVDSTTAVEDSGGLAGLSSSDCVAVYTALNTLVINCYNDVPSTQIDRGTSTQYATLEDCVNAGFFSPADQQRIFNSFEACAALGR